MTKTKTKSGNVAERAAVNNLVKELRKKYRDGVYVFIDRDAGGQRHTSSGWDFLICRGPYAVFVEAKVGPGKLTEYQELTRAEVQAAGGCYLVARFSEDGKRVAVDGGPARAVAGISTADFFRGGK
ncbi:MAG: hypothetical protein E6Q97_16755 [Desulfurellales bacterium]|nr:MAG: hypothetical protein E6Q97_16755 [Desulfurellales bacterium]